MSLPFFIRAMKRYTTFNDILRSRFGCRIQRVSLDAGFTCPNRDGSLGTGGCRFCNERGAAAVGVPVNEALPQQLHVSKEYLRRKFRAEKFLAYFQAYTNTYGSVDQLRTLYASVLHDPEVVGLIIGTRPDCLPDDVLDLLSELHLNTYLWLELGMQTMHDRTLDAINRGHDHNCFVEAVQRCKKRGLRVCAHLILGLPGETEQEMQQSVLELNRLGVDGVKFHHLHVLKGSAFADDYCHGRLTLLTRDAYVNLVCNLLELLDPKLVVQRLMGDGRSELIAPDWSRRKLDVLNRIDAELAKRDSRQGSRLSHSGK